MVLFLHSISVRILKLCFLLCMWVKNPSVYKKEVFSMHTLYELVRGGSHNLLCIPVSIRRLCIIYIYIYTSMHTSYAYYRDGTPLVFILV